MCFKNWNVLLTLWLILILHEFRPKLIAANYYFCANLEQNFEDLTQRKRYRYLKTFPKLLRSKLTLRLKRQVKRAKELKLSLAPFDRQLLIDSHCNLLNSLRTVQIVTPYYDTSVRKYIQWFFNRLNNSVCWFSNSHTDKWYNYKTMSMFFFT